MAKSDWKLTVADNGLGRSGEEDSKTSAGLGTALVGALAKQLKAQVTQSIDKVSRAIPKVIYWAVTLYVAWTIVQFYTARINTFNEILKDS